jgi:hypothetical protein
MKYNKQTRRHFLQGLGGFALAMPTLFSLLPKAQAQALAANNKIFVAIGSLHGGLQDDLWLPSVAATNTQQLYTGDPNLGLDHVMRWDYLRNMKSSTVGTFNPTGQNIISPVLGDHLNGYIDNDYITLLNGIDFPFYSGHHRAWLGCFHDLDGPLTNYTHPALPSIDQVMGELIFVLSKWRPDGNSRDYSWKLGDYVSQWDSWKYLVNWSDRRWR